ncbi:uncharacterized protein LOC105841475 [Bombyx mori]|uniref:uncharacterized protein LOC105841475 n=1 Tax=Bombyx mori TaxID=7091 RepID=UPI000B3C7D95
MFSDFKNKEMTYKKSLNLLLTLIAVPEVLSWTIDLPEIRKYVFEKNELEKKEENKRLMYKKMFDDFNIDSLNHNVDNKEMKYARKYGYHSYMEKKVSEIVHEGSVYLEGLRRSIEQYALTLEACNRANNESTPWLPAIELPTEITANSNTTDLPGNITNIPGNISTVTNNQTNITPSSNLNGNNTNSRLSNLTSTRPGLAAAGVPSSTAYNSSAGFDVRTFLLALNETCQRVSRASEHVRRLAGLAMSTTRRLQDLAYADKYQKDADKEENELILKLAWLLDRLAHLTGFEVNPKDFLEATTTTTTSSPFPTFIPPDIMQTPEEVKNYLMRCLKMKSEVPAIVRCRYPLAIPPMVASLYNVTETSADSESSSSTSIPDILEPIPDESSLELLMATDDNPLREIPKSIVKRSLHRNPSPNLSDLSAVNAKRNVRDKPARNFANFHLKHKVWANSEIEEAASGDFTRARSVKKRSLDNERFLLYRLLQNHRHDTGLNYHKHRPGVSYSHSKNVVDKIREHLARMRQIIDAIKRRSVKRSKRSLKYERMSLPRVSEDPFQDISFYVKNKRGTNYQRDVAQAARVRAGLERIYQTGNIEVVRRYGTNYNPLIPAPLYAGVLKTMADA